MNNLLAEVDIGTHFQVNPRMGIGNTILYQNPGNLITILVRNAYMVSGLILFGLLIFGGLTYIINIGSGDSKKAAKGTKAISSALLGFLVVFASYWIIQIIQAIFDVPILNTTL